MNKNKLNNKGSALILVIICVAFIGILSSVMLSATVANIQMKSANQSVKSNFYSAEIAMEEIRIGVCEIAAKELEKAYAKTLEQFSQKNEEERQQLFATEFINGLNKELSLNGTVSDKVYNTLLVSNFIKEPGILIDIEVGKNELIKDDADPLNPKYIVLKNVKVGYKDTNDYFTTIRSDIVINLPSISVAVPGDSFSGLYDSFFTFGLIADNQISIQAVNPVSVRGDVYAGNNGIFLDNNSKLFLDGKKIITRGDMAVKNRSTLEVTGNANVWAKNIATLQGENTSDKTSININGKAYVADDLMLNAMESNVVLQGEYYGYNSSVLAEASESSSIIINGKNSTLNLSGLKELLIAGRAYIDPNSRGNVETTNDFKIETGESLAVKSNQVAYLVPSEYIWMGTNPVNGSALESKPESTLEVDFTKAGGKAGGIKISNYASSYRKVYYRTPSSEKIVYYYLKFNSKEKANEYMQKYYEINNDSQTSGIGIIDNRIKTYAENIKVATGLTTILSEGNIFTYSKETEKSNLIKNTVNPDVDANTLTSLTDSMRTKYTSLSQSLQETPTTVYNANSVFENIVDKNKLISDNALGGVAGFYNGVKKISVGSLGTVYFVENSGSSAPFEVPASDRMGIVVATGDVVLNGTYQGLILSGRTITSKPTASVIADDKLLADIFGLYNDDINNYFRSFAGKKPTTKVPDNTQSILNISDFVSYDNWVKNED